jgi:hypothetical protein
MMVVMSNGAQWPELPTAWSDTYATLHMWSQVVGKIALAKSPPLNQSWGVALHLNARGLTTLPLSHDARTFTIAFDFIDHVLAIRVSDGDERLLPLRPQTVADFYRKVMAALGDLHLPVLIRPVPVEIPDPIPFDQDTVHASYEPVYANSFWRILLECERIFVRARCNFIGKASPVHFFWGAFDLACTRFSGRRAPAREGPAFMREAYSQEVISHGFWPGSGPVKEPSFYAYAVPEPAGFQSIAVRPPQAFYHHELGEFILPYAAVREAPDPDRALLDFIYSTYEQGATLAGWDRAALEQVPIG